MYAYIRGILAEVEEDLIVVEAGGVGYNIYITGQMFDILPQRGAEVKIHTYLSVREDAMQLYGFPTRDDLKFFKLLIGVNGIGPKGALGILSAMSADDLRFAVLADDAKAISKAPGVGAKTAQRLILELKDKISLEDAFEQKLANTADGTRQKNANAAQNEAVQALTALGYGASEALRAVNAVENAGEMEVEDILKAALKNMALF